MTTKFNIDNLAKNLPDVFKKTPESNNAKILAIEKSEMDRLRENIRAIDESLDLDRAYGATLDLYGEMLSQERGKATDDQYRVLIKARIIRNLVNGNYNSIVRLLSLVFNCEASEISLIELDTPCRVRLDSLPFESLNRLVIDINTALKIVDEIMPAGVKLESVQFTGTFEFGEIEPEYDDDAGFGDVDQTVGGYLGYIFSGDTPVLPV